MATSLAFAEIAGELDVLCKSRTEVWPVRDETYAELSVKLVDFCHWLQSRQPEDWEPEPGLVQSAEAMTPIFIGGFMKSGTTFVLNLLDGHPEISALPGDAMLLRFAKQHVSLSPDEQAQALREVWIHRLVNPTGLSPFWLFGRRESAYVDFINYLDYWIAKTPHPYQRMISAVAWAYYSANPKRPAHPRYWVDKSPTQESHIDELLLLYPDAYFVQVVRNPLASIAAIKAMEMHRGNSISIYKTAHALRNSMRIGLDNLERFGEDRYIIIRYEDIVADPSGSMRALAERLGIAYDRVLIEPTINGIPSTPNSAYRQSRLLRGQIHTQSLEQWRKRLAPGESAEIVERLCDEASAYGYDWRDLRPRNILSARLGRILRSTGWTGVVPWLVGWVLRHTGRALQEWAEN